MTSTISPVRGLAEDLIAAKALIDTPEKWGKGSPRRPAGCLCAMDALTKGVYRRFGFNRFSAAESVLKANLKRGAKHIAQFNDWPSTTHADIMALFDRAIAAAEVTP